MAIAIANNNVAIANSISDGVIFLSVLWWQKALLAMEVFAVSITIANILFSCSVSCMAWILNGHVLFFVKNNSKMFNFTQGCLPMQRWDELNDFFKNAWYFDYLTSYK